MRDLTTIVAMNERAVADHERRIRDIEETTIDALNAAGERICEARNAPAPRHPVETRYAVRYTPRNGDQKPRYATTNRFSWAWRAPAEVWKRIEDLTSPVDAFRAAEREFPKHTSVHSVRLVAFRKWSDDTVTAEEV